MFSESQDDEQIIERVAAFDGVTSQRTVTLWWSRGE